MTSTMVQHSYLDEKNAGCCHRCGEERASSCHVPTVGGVAADADGISETQITALACISSPERMEDAVMALPPERLLPALWWADELLRRAHQFRKAVLIEASVALANGEIQPELRLADKRYVFRTDSKNEIDDVPGLLYYLNRVGASLTDLGGAVGYLRVTDIQRVIGTLPEDVQADAYATLEAHRIKKSTGFALIDLDQRAKYRKTK